MYKPGDFNTLVAGATYEKMKQYDVKTKNLRNMRHQSTKGILWQIFNNGFKRQNGDERKDNPGFGIVNATVIAKNFLSGFELRGSVYNLFDKEYTFPSEKGELPEDYHGPDRHFLVEVRYTF